MRSPAVRFAAAAALIVIIVVATFAYGNQQRAKEQAAQDSRAEEVQKQSQAKRDEKKQDAGQQESSQQGESTDNSADKGTTVVAADDLQESAQPAASNTAQAADAPQQIPATGSASMISAALAFVVLGWLMAIGRRNKIAKPTAT